jgi:molybdate transport system substrate-binding protein
LSSSVAPFLLPIFLLFFTSAPGVGQVTLTVAAASDLTNVQPALTAAFRKFEPKIEVRFVTGASAILKQQIAEGAPYDVFLSANAEFVDQLGSSRKLLPESIKSYATGRVGVLWSDKKRHNINDLTQSWVRFVALPNPKLAPYGVAAQQALEHAGIWKQVQPKVVYGENVRQTLQLFESGNADAVLTSDSLLQGKNPDLVPADWHRPIIQKGGIVAASKNRSAAQEFLDFVLSRAGQAVLAQFGFGTATP